MNHFALYLKLAQHRTLAILQFFLMVKEKKKHNPSRVCFPGLMYGCLERRLLSPGIARLEGWEGGSHHGPQSSPKDKVLLIRSRGSQARTHRGYRNQSL